MSRDPYPMRGESDGEASKTRNRRERVAPGQVLRRPRRRRPLRKWRSSYGQASQIPGTQAILFKAGNASEADRAMLGRSAAYVGSPNPQGIPVAARGWRRDTPSRGGCIGEKNALA